MRIALAQINPAVGDFGGNKKLILNYIREAEKFECDLIAFPELAITGYPPEDLIYKKSFIDENLSTLEEIAKTTEKIIALVGFIDRDDSLYNAMAVLSDGKIVGKYYKMHLPNYGVFDEERYFKSGETPMVCSLEKVNIGVNICEDIWTAEGPAKIQVFAGDAHLIINISASPFHAGKAIERERMLITRAVDYSSYVCYVNMVGAQDELVFDGRSLIIDDQGKIVARGKAFEEDLVVADIDIESTISRRVKNVLWQKEREKLARAQFGHLSLPDIIIKKKRKEIHSVIHPQKEKEEEIYSALVLGVRDYVKKNNFRKVLIGLSGGIDSSLTACIAVDALGKESVVGVSMPSVFTSRETKEDAEKIAKNLGIEFYEIPIKKIHQAFLKELDGIFKNTKPGIAEENIQARIRGTILMTISNKFGWLVLTTGNKSEVSTGYCTLYGDTAGGFAPLKDVAKTEVYALAEYRNKLQGEKLIPESIIRRPPTAELKPNQKDQDTLPPYEILDKIIEGYVEKDLTYEELIRSGLNKQYINKAVEMIVRSEYKRRQSPPGVKITHKSFGKDRRYPITNKFIETSLRRNKQ
jgi:NAD+ synthase (glutamine-hydrolysing)